MRSLARKAAELAGSGLGPEDCLGLTFVGLEEMAQVNSSFVGHEGPTDVICFDYRQGAGQEPCGDDLSVDIVICPEVALREALKRRLPYARELVLYMVHGLLHAAGEDDLSPVPRKRMRRLEREIVADLKKKFIFSMVFPSP